MKQKLKFLLQSNGTIPNIFGSTNIKSGNIKNHSLEYDVPVTSGPGVPCQQLRGPEVQ